MSKRVENEVHCFIHDCDIVPRLLGNEAIPGFIKVENVEEGTSMTVIILGVNQLN
jgi:hypothetical protein